MSKTTQGLIDLLTRHDIKPTGDSIKDIKLAREFMPAPYNNKERNHNE
jgi:hypothetical protein